MATSRRNSTEGTIKTSENIKFSLVIESPAHGMNYVQTTNFKNYIDMCSKLKEDFVDYDEPNNQRLRIKPLTNPNQEGT